MRESESKHVFVSYVREDSDAVDELCSVLEAAQIPYWRDRSALGPGDAWKAKIRQAIREGSLVFLACFSNNSRAKDKSYMNEELTLAIEEFRKMPPGRTWLIPLRLDDGDLPEWDLGAGRTLDDLNYSNLFGKGYAAEAAKLVTTIHRVMGDKRLDAASALAAVEQATSAGRTDLLKRLTKEMLLDPSRRIELDDLVSQEVKRVMEILNDPQRVAGPFAGSNNELVVRVAREAQELWSLTEPFCASLQVAARWGMADHLAPWANGLKAFLVSTTRIEGGGVDALLELRHLPGMAGVFTACLASAASRNWSGLRALVIEPTVRDRYQNTPLPLVEVTDVYKPFGATEWVALTLARATLQGKDLTEALEDYTQRQANKYHTPAAEWLHHVLRPIFADQTPDEQTYDSEFDRAEVMLAAIAQDQANIRASSNPDEWRGSRTYSHWFGRSIWRAARSYWNPVKELQQELSTQGAQWGPLEGSLFGGDQERANTALETTAENFGRAARNRW
jgi:hypothetical protein